jgi:hypothetical protein
LCGRLDNVNHIAVQLALDEEITRCAVRHKVPELIVVPRRLQ